MLDTLVLWFQTHVSWWTAFGMAGQLLFMSRFLVQWVASEKAGRSLIPEAFWYFSLAGGIIVMIYGIQRDDLVIIMGQMFGVIVYVRNLILIYREKGRRAHESAIR